LTKNEDKARIVINNLLNINRDLVIAMRGLDERITKLEQKGK